LGGITLTCSVDTVYDNNAVGLILKTSMSTIWSL